MVLDLKSTHTTYSHRPILNICAIQGACQHTHPPEHTHTHTHTNTHTHTHMQITTDTCTHRHTSKHRPFSRQPRGRVGRGELQQGQNVQVCPPTPPRIPHNFVCIITS